MLGKYIIFTTLLALVALNLAEESGLLPPRPRNQNATQCYTCDSPSSCRGPKIVACDQKSANATRLTLAKYFSDVENITNSQFECTKISYSLKYATVLAVRGCINVGLRPCRLQPKNVLYTTHVCESCNKNLCNIAGTFSFSSAIMMSSIFALLSLKFLFF